MLFQQPAFLYGIGSTVALFLALAVVARLKLAIWIVGVILFSATIGIVIADNAYIYSTWLFPLQALRSEVFLLGNIVIFLGLVGHLRLVSFRVVSSQAIFLFVIALFAATMRIYQDSVRDGVLTAGFACITFIPLIFGVPAMVRSHGDWFPLVRVIMWVNIAWIAASAVQFVVDPSKSTMVSRFIGVSPNPQFAALALTFPAVTCLWLIFNDPKSRYRWLWICTFGIDIVLLGWTGSRTGAILTIIGVTAVLYRRLGRAILMLPFSALAVWAAYQAALALDINLGLERLTHGEDTRSAVWAALLEQGLQNPVTGAGGIDAAASENSYLLGFASYGVGGLACAVGFLLYSMWFCLKLYRYGRYGRPYRMIIDLIIAFNMMYFIGAIFEGYMFARVAATSVYMLIFGGIAAAMLHFAREEEAAALESGEYVDDEDEEYDAEAADPSQEEFEFVSERALGEE